MSVDNCRLCAASRKHPFELDLPSGLNELSVVCETCGNARITKAALNELKVRRVPKPWVQGYIRAHSNKEGNLRIDSGDVDRIESEGREVSSVSEKLNRLLTQVGRRTTHPGQTVSYSWTEFSLVYAENREELRFLFSELHAQGLVAYKEGLVERVKLLSKGWERIEELQRSRGSGRRCFVAMSFDEEHRPAWDTIKKAVADADFEPYRIDEAQHADLIPMKILSDIRASRFVVADLTAHKRGVYFEAGYGLGLGRPVIWVCRKDELDGAHFDVKQYNTILYSDLEYLERHLRERIRALIA